MFTHTNTHIGVRDVTRRDEKMNGDRYTNIYGYLCLMEEGWKEG